MRRIARRGAARRRAGGASGAGGVALTAGGAEARLLRPAALRPGDRIAVVAGSGLLDPGQVDAGLALLRARGFDVVAAPLREPNRYMAAPDRERLEDLVAAFADPSVRAVWCARGGYGMVRLLPGLDPAWLRERRKLVIGYSDATALLAHMVQGAGVAALHGPMVASDLQRQADCGALDHLLAIAAGTTDWSIPVPFGIATGEVEAPLRGGCLAVLVSLAGTPYAPRFADSIALLEDVGERPQRRIDRMLVQLRQSGLLDGVRGIVFGAMPDCGDADEIRATIADCLGDLDVPVGYGAKIGHGVANFAVPLGVRVRLRVDSLGETFVAPAGRVEGLDPLVA